MKSKVIIAVVIGFILIIVLMGSLAGGSDKNYKYLKENFGAGIDAVTSTIKQRFPDAKLSSFQTWEIQGDPNTLYRLAGNFTFENSLHSFIAIYKDGNLTSCTIDKSTELVEWPPIN